MTQTTTHTRLRIETRRSGSRIAMATITVLGAILALGVMAKAAHATPAFATGDGSFPRGHVAQPAPQAPRVELRGPVVTVHDRQHRHWHKPHYRQPDIAVGHGAREDRMARDAQKHRAHRYRTPQYHTPGVYDVGRKHGGHWHDGPYHYGKVPPRRIIRFLRRHGMHNFSDIRIGAHRYRVRATGPRGARLAFAFDAYTGQLERIRLISRPGTPSWRFPYIPQGVVLR